ncbi:MAG: sugar phosphate isomerase/epimerase [Candidatus Omnitrophica bacterium]|nr:sugar phosphate isomerase/epimerase [Candidatus Omnitrophota bacterium]
MPLALSTSWNALRYAKARDMLFEISKLGFTDLELSFNLTPLMVSEIAALKEKLKLKVRSVHNFCPIPDEFQRKDALPDCYSISSFDKEERAQALKYTKRTIDTASLLGAQVVILHCGRVEMEDQTRKLIDLYDRGLKDTESYRLVKQEFLRDRASIATPFLDYTLSSLEELNKYAAEKSVYLGVENRFYYREIPNLEELGVILGEFKSSRIFYWHDTGHARVMENLGFYAQQDYLELYGKAMIGAHIHNVIGCRDHQAPASGDLDFSMLKPYLKKETLKVIEAHQPATAKDIKNSKELLERIFDGLI